MTGGAARSIATLPATASAAPTSVTMSPVVSFDFDAEGRPVTGAPATITITNASVSQSSTLTVEAESGYVH